jgi:hypothetical protein
VKGEERRNTVVEPEVCFGSIMEARVEERGKGKMLSVGSSRVRGRLPELYS